MPRPLRREFEGAIYHLMSRGDRKEPIFLSDLDRTLFIETLAAACRKTDWQVHALCLMDNHFHLVLEMPKANMVAGMKWLLGTYTIRFNKRHNLAGHLFSGRYKALLVDGSSPGYFRTVCDYVHLNPSRAKLISPRDPLPAYRWSSYPEYLKPPTRRWPWLRTDRLLAELGCEDTASGRKSLERHLEARRHEDEPADWAQIRRGWFFGSDAVKNELLEDARGVANRPIACWESDEAKAQRIIREELSKSEWTEVELRASPKGDPVKVRIANRLRAETPVPVQWIAKRLHMGSRSYASNLLLECQ